MATAAPAVLRRGARAWVTHAARLALLLIVAGIAGFGALVLTGHRAMVVLSGSMSPAIETGDLVVTRIALPREVEVGDVVTFNHPERDDLVVTHRVKKVVNKGDTYAFVTKGDANDTVERWGIEREGNLGKAWFTIPNAGWALGRLAQPTALAIAASLCLAMITVLGLQRIWRS